MSSPMAAVRVDADAGRATVAPPTAPKRVFGGLGSFVVVAGSMMGIGIFLAPPVVARSVDTPLLFFTIWVFGGVVALGGAVACGELATMFPRCGGDYVFQREAFGPSVAFASGWVLLAAIFGGSIAASAAGLSTYQIPALLGADMNRSLPLVWGGSVTLAQGVAVALVLALTAVNHMGARLSGRFQIWATLIPIAMVLTGAAYALAAEAPSAPPISTAAPAVSATGLVAAYLPVYFAYSGWNGVIYISGEVKNPHRNLPLSLVGGTLAVTLLYGLLCLGFLRLLGIQGLREVGEASAAGARALAGPSGERIMTVVVAIALLASLNCSILGSSRVAYAMAADRSFWPPAARLHPRRGVPTRALWLQAGWASLLIISERFEQILNMVSVAMVVLGSLTVGSLFLLRWRRPEATRPYRAFGYPVLPLLYLLSNAVVILVMLPSILSPEPGAFYPLLGLGILGFAYLSHRLRVV